MSGKRVYVMLSAPKEAFVNYCRSGLKSWQIPGFPWQVFDSLESARKRCCVLNRTESNSTHFVYFYKSIYFYSV